MPRAKDNPGGSEYSVSRLYTHTQTLTHTHTHTIRIRFWTNCTLVAGIILSTFGFGYAMLCPITYLHYYSFMQSTWIALTPWNQPPHLSYIEFPFTLGVKGHLPKSSNQLHAKPLPTIATYEDMLSQNHLKPNQRLFTVLHPKHVIILVLLGCTYSKHCNHQISLNNIFHSMRCPFIEIIQMDDWVFLNNICPTLFSTNPYQNGFHG
jgi:hypothetical protein